jgi:hypothetical protein
MWLPPEVAKGKYGLVYRSHFNQKSALSETVIFNCCQ